MDERQDMTSLAAYLEAIFASERCERTAGGRWRCAIPVLAGWVVEGDSRNQCVHAAEKRVVEWVARRLARDEPLPALGELRPVVAEVALPEVVTERLRLVPFTARLLAAATFNRAMLAARLGVRIHPGWPYPAVRFDEEEAAGAEEPPLAYQLTIPAVLFEPEVAPWKWMIVHARDGVLVGEIGTLNPPRVGDTDDHFQMSYSLVPEYQRRGYMTEAARAYVAWAFTHPAVKWIYAATEGENVASRRVLEKLGARPFHVDEEIGWIDWELLPEDFARGVAGAGQPLG